MAQNVDTEKIQNQSTEEWLAEYNHGKKVEYKHVKRKQDNSKYLFHYVDHRTTKRGSVALDFESLDKSINAVRFFNVSLSGLKGKLYPAKDRGQFNPPRRGLFRQFWMRSVGKEPLRWSRVHKSMRSSLKNLVFIGEVKQALDSSGQTYTKLTEVKLYSEHEVVTVLVRNGHEMSTERARTLDTNL